MADFREREERILKFWEDHHIFQKSMEQRRGAKPFVFFEGPPTANAAPAIHHFIGRVFKDAIPRYQTMRGRYVLRKGGWDTHGLPVELQVEKALGFKNKKDIEAYGIAAFNRQCRESVWQNKEEWTRFTRRIGYWTDLDDPYVTYETPYMESLWNVISKFAGKKLLYQAHRVVPFCTRCGTPLSSHEVNLGYKTVADTAVTVKFKVLRSKIKLPKNTFILAWTTTPWTLPGNVALAVGKDISYVLARKGEEYFIVAEDLANKVLGAPLAIERTLSGKDLMGISYVPLFSIRALKKPTSYKVYEADFVTTTDGTGVVHTAVMYGEDDYKLGDRLKLVKHHTVDEVGKFVGVGAGLDGMYVKGTKTEETILSYLRENNTLLSQEPYEHEYPFCWRCDTPLLYYAKDSWFVRMSALNKQMLANNDKVNWIPSHIKEGRFGQWLKEAKDWAFSRERYWGTPLPVWMARDAKGHAKGTPLVISSLEDLDTFRADNPATLWFIRHGEAENNVAGLIDSGEQPLGLTEKGRMQAKKTAVQLKHKLSGKKAPVAIIASPILRTRQTAEIIARELGVKKVIFDERLKEINLGPSLRDCHDDAYYRQYPTYESKFTQRPPGGESLADLRMRMWGVVKDLHERYAGKNVIVVSHDYPIWMAADAAQGWSMKESIAEKEGRGDDFVTFAEIEQVVVRNLPRDDQGIVDLHRPYIDQIKLRRKGSRETLLRVPELVDVWFDSGAMPYAQWHWPFEQKDIFTQQFPADFITEGIDQTRGWFYTLLAVSTALGLGAPYRAVMSYSHVLDEKGQKMSKSKGNVVKPEEVIDAVGVDAARWYFYTINNPGDPKTFSMKDVRERLTGFIMTLENCARFYELYRSADEHGDGEPSNLLDVWLVSRLNRLIQDVTERFDRYDLTGAGRSIEQFVIEDFSQWWLRRSRKRTESLSFLRSTLHQLALLIAPLVPFTADDLWHRLSAQSKPGTPISVHLADWPKANPASINDSVEEHMKQIRECITAGLALRKQEEIKVRQPLLSVTVPIQPLHVDLEALLREELNVKKVQYALGEPVAMDFTVTAELRAEGWAREAMRTIQDMRKEAGLQVGDKALVWWHTDDTDLAEAMEQYAGDIARDTGLEHFMRQAEFGTIVISKDFEIGPGKLIRLGLRA
jgi:isoleucyl-tRNA synthetase